MDIIKNSVTLEPLDEYKILKRLHDLKFHQKYIKNISRVVQLNQEFFKVVYAYVLQVCTLTFSVSELRIG